MFGKVESCSSGLVVCDNLSQIFCPSRFLRREILIDEINMGYVI